MRYVTTELKTNRSEGLTDGIFAISMTILVLSFEGVLHNPIVMSEKEFLDKIIRLLPDLLHYIESFILLGVFWFLHHQQFHYIKRTDAVLVFINILGLMFVGLVPFTTVMVSDYGQLLPAALLFEINLLLAGIMFFIHWMYATKNNHLVEKHLDRAVVKYYMARNLIIPIVSLCAIGVSFLNPLNSIILLLVVPVVLIVFRRKNIKVIS